MSFETSDGLELPGLLYEPDIKTDKVAIFLHGNGSSSIFSTPYYGDIYSKALNSAGIAYFPFDNRGAHIVNKLNKKVDGVVYRLKFGSSFELIKECIFDINGAIDFLRTLGFKTFYLIGASTGANKICVYNFYHPTNPVEKYVLLCGGDDSGIYYQEFGAEKFQKILQESKEKIKEGKGTDLAPPEWMGIYSYLAIYDILNPDGDYNTFPFNDALNKLNLSTKELFKEFKSIDRQTLVIYGQNDEFCYGRVPEIVELLKTKVSRPDKFSFQILPDADHGFTGQEEHLVDNIATWL